MRNVKNNKGFTLIELIVVITILAIIAVIATQSVGNILAKSRAQADVTSAEVIGSAMARAYAEQKLTSTEVPVNGTWYVLSGTMQTNLVTTNHYLGAVPTLKADTTNYGTWWFVADLSAGTFQIYAGPSASASAANSVLLYPRPASMTGSYTILN